MSTTDLVRMINQIAANQRHLPDDVAAARVAEHVAAFWAPRMRDDLAAAVADGTADLDPVAAAALALLAQPASA